MEREREADPSVILTPGRAGSVDLLGGALCLDFANTVEPRVEPRHDGRRREYLTGYSDVVAWGRHAGALTDAEAQRLLVEAPRHPDDAAAAFAAALALREATYIRAGVLQLSGRIQVTGGKGGPGGSDGCDTLGTGRVNGGAHGGPGFIMLLVDTLRVPAGSLPVNGPAALGRTVPADPAPATDAPGALYVPATDHTVAAPFVAAFRRLGPYLLGHPLTEAYRDHDVLVQVFAHLRLELRGGAAVPGALGRDLHPLAPRRAAVASTATRRYFLRTGQILSGELLAFWQAHGGEALLGDPISGVVYQQNGDGSGRFYASQWFDNACLEVHPESANPRFHVLLRLLGRDYLAGKGWL